MPPDGDYSLQQLADLADVTLRTIRYYIAQGLLPSPGQVGPGARYGEGHLARLRLIRALQREHLPLAEIRMRLAGIGDEEVVRLLEGTPRQPVSGSAVDYIRGVLAASSRTAAPDGPLKPDMPALPSVAPAIRAGAHRVVTPEAVAPSPGPSPRVPGASAPRDSPNPSNPPNPGRLVADRSQWDRVVLVPDIELHVRRPLTRQQNRQVDRLIAIARELLEEDPS